MHMKFSQLNLPKTELSLLDNSLLYTQYVHFHVKNPGGEYRRNRSPEANDT